ncbi:hypothetical protein [Rosettibacter firmus]|uniref:hypothetical protein n=1 Tax=Rosettibacter firmus TaxID=3111522 RepID=UPI00336BBBC5
MNSKNILFFLLLILLFTINNYAKVINSNSIPLIINDVIVCSDNTNVSSQKTLGKFVPLTGDIEQLKNFFNALKNSKNRIIKIAHYGDSLIQGDVITEYLREFFQEKFGGKGIGFLSIVSNDIKMKTSIRHSYSDDWKYVSIVTRNPENLPLGISGAVAIPKINSWVKYETTENLKSTSSFNLVKIYYSNADNNSVIQYKINNGNATNINLESGQSLKELKINLNVPGKSFEMKFISGKAPYIYGVSLESGNGVYVDNFPMPGNSGVSLLQISESVLQDFKKYSDYSLIILTYGANVNAPKKEIFNYYESKMINVIEFLRRAFPNAGIILVGVGDKTMKVGNKFITNPDVPLLLAAQKKITEKSKVAFWNLWEAMGGENSMIEWVSANPPMALKDFSHFTQIGGKRIAQLLFDAIMDAYKKM